MTEIQKLLVELVCFQDAQESGDFFFEIEGVTEDEADDHISLKITELQAKISELESQ